jgi:autonomous glycyl radical cofactor GrcA
MGAYSMGTYNGEAGTHLAVNLLRRTAMMKPWTLIAIAAVSVGASAQSTAPTTGEGTAVRFVSLTAELGKNLSAKS